MAMLAPAASRGIISRGDRQLARERLGNQADVCAARTTEVGALNILGRAFGTEHSKLSPLLINRRRPLALILERASQRPCFTFSILSTTHHAGAQLRIK
jgi:hypothetical protein